MNCTHQEMILRTRVKISIILFIFAVMKVKIYCLYEPHTSKIRYIGRTKGLLRKRLATHLCKAKQNNNNSHKENWIRCLVKNGIKPRIRLLIELDTTWIESHNFEKRLIETYFEKHNLVNGVDAGPGILSKNISTDMEQIRVAKIKEHFNKEENKSNFYNKIYCYNIDNTFKKEYVSTKFAAEELEIKPLQITNHINRFDNYNMNVNPIKGYYFSKFKHENRIINKPLTVVIL